MSKGARAVASIALACLAACGRLHYDPEPPDAQAADVLPAQDGSRADGSGDADGGRSGPGWVWQFGGSRDDVATAVAIDTTGNVVVTGVFFDRADFGGGTLASGGDFDVFVAAYSATGAHRWSKRFGGTGHDEGKSIALDSAGNAYVVGYFSGTADFGTGVLTSAGGSDVVVASYAPDGTARWSQRFGATGEDRGYAVGVGADAVVIGGSFAGAVDFGATPLTSASTFDAFVASIPLAGSPPTWARAIGGDVIGGEDAVRGAGADASGNVYVSGHFGGTADLGMGPLTAVGGADIFLASYGATGSLRWAQLFGGAADDLDYALAVDGSGNVTTSGTFDSTIDFGGGVLSSAGASDGFIASFTASGMHRWSHALPGAGYQAALGLAPGVGGGVLASGLFEASVDIDGRFFVAAGALDAWIATFDATGAARGARTLGGSGEDGALGIVPVVSDGTVIVVGFTEVGGLGDGTFVSMGGLDGFVLRAAL